MPLHPLHERHDRYYDAFQYVYPVLSRRAGGMSVGVNLNPDRACNFRCIYCQIERDQPTGERFVDTDRLVDELDLTLAKVISGDLFKTDQFSLVPEEKRRLVDIAFSGDGEPTLYTNFDEIVGLCAAVKRRRGLDDVTMVLITNASMLHSATVRRGLDILAANNGEIWAKLDAGTEAFFQTVSRTRVPFRQVLDNITQAARDYRVLVQTMFMRLAGQGPSEREIDAYISRLTEIVAAGGIIQKVQIYTVARPPFESGASALTNAEVDSIVEQIRQGTSLDVEGYYGRIGLE